MRLARLIIPGLTALALTGVPAAASAASGGAGISSSAPGLAAPVSTPGAQVSTPAQPLVPGIRARIIKGVAYAPSLAPAAVQKAIWAGNAIRRKPYVYGGGHGVWNDSGYDCSGSVSYVLHAAGLLKVSMDSSEFEGWGKRGVGQWITVYTNPDHAFVEIAGIRLDTSAEGDPNPSSGSGPRWRPLLKDTGDFVSRHPAGY